MGNGTRTRTHTHTLSEATGLDRALIIAGLRGLDFGNPLDLEQETDTPVKLEDGITRSGTPAERSARREARLDELYARIDVLVEAIRHGNVEIPALGEAEGE